jgi:spore coat protein CotF
MNITAYHLAVINGNRLYAVKGFIMQLSQKEKMLLTDDKNQEEICVIKYKNYSGQAQDPQLKQLFNTLSTEEQHHYDMINQMLQGQQPNMNHPQQSQQPTGQTQQSSYQGTMGNTGDKVLCSDLLSTEKFVSGVYDTGIFETANPTVRQALQHIQQDEQHHGEILFNYMNSHGMYNVQ